MKGDMQQILEVRVKSAQFGLKSWTLERGGSAHFNSTGLQVIGMQIWLHVLEKIIENYKINLYTPSKAV